MWGDLFGKKDKEFEEFLANPKDLYERIKMEVEALQTENKELKISVEDLEKSVEDLYEERDKLIEKNNKQIIDIERLEGSAVTYRRQYESDIVEAKNKMAEDYQKIEKELREKNVIDYKTAIAKKSAELEKQYHHEVHTFIETQNDKFLETIPNVVRETIIGFHNEMVNK